MLRAVLSFAVSICILSVVQGALVALPGPRSIPALARLRSGWWALVPVASVVGFVFGARALSGVAGGLTYLALIAVPALAALALAGARAARGRGSRSPSCPSSRSPGPTVPGSRGRAPRSSSKGSRASRSGCCSSPSRRRRWSSSASSRWRPPTTWLVVSDLLQAPNNALNVAAPAAHLPQLQRAVFGAAVMGYGDLFIAALFGALLAAQPRLALRGALAVAFVALVSDALFLVVNELPATVPIALVLLAGEAYAAARRHRSRQVGSQGGSVELLDHE